MSELQFSYAQENYNFCLPFATILWRIGRECITTDLSERYYRIRLSEVLSKAQIRSISIHCEYEKIPNPVSKSLVWGR